MARSGSLVVLTASSSLAENAGVGDGAEVLMLPFGLLRFVEAAA